MACIGGSGGFEDIFAQTSEDVRNLECQIRNQLKLMDVVESIVNAPKLALPELVSIKEDYQPATRMQWHESDDFKKPKKGKLLPENKPAFQLNQGGENEAMECVSALDIMEMCVNEKISKYIPVPESTFFVPILDNCVFGMSLVNVGLTKLRKPSINLSILEHCSEEPGKKKPLCRCFLYDVQVNIKETNAENINLSKSEEGLAYQDGFNSDVDSMGVVIPGCEVLITATFLCPMQLLAKSDNCSLLVSVYLDNDELWAREIPIANNYFTAPHIDSMFKSNHLSIITALGVEREIFKMERLLVQDELAPHKVIEKFLMPLGFENIKSFRTGIDTVIEVYTTQQPSLLWGTCFKIEKCSRKPSSIRCLVTSRTSDQMRFFFTQFHFWLKSEGHKGRTLGPSEIIISSLLKENNSSFCKKLQAEIDLILKFHQVKSIFRREREGGRTQKRYSRNDIGSIDSCWIHEYSKCVEKTDLTFINKTQ